MACKPADKLPVLKLRGHVHNLKACGAQTTFTSCGASLAADLRSSCMAALCQVRPGTLSRSALIARMSLLVRSKLLQLSGISAVFASVGQLSAFDICWAA
eukprot:1943408-Rhodomonas_salina.4